jgi:hypothetical protein
MSRRTVARPLFVRRFDNMPDQIFQDTADAAAAKPSRSELLRKAIRLEWLTAAWLLIEATVAIGSGIAANSLSLIAFGADRHCARMPSNRLPEPIPPVWSCSVCSLSF